MIMPLISVLSLLEGKTISLNFQHEIAIRPFLIENESMWQFFEPELRKRLADIEVEAFFASRVRSSLFELLPSGLSSIDDVAKNLSVSKRTLPPCVRIVVTCGGAQFFNWGRALGLSLLLLGLSVLFLDNFSEERADIYHQAIVNELEMK